MPIKCPRCSHENPDDTNFCGKCSAPLEPKPASPQAATETLELQRRDFKTGDIVAGRYEIVECLGRGGMGTVYKAHDLQVREEVALKIIRPEIAGSARVIQRFQNELKLARKISHRNVCRMFDLGKDGAVQFITMEYVPGEDLKTTIRRIGPMTIRKAVDIGKQICQGLSEAHALGILHRDLKPSNIIVDREGHVRIMDFGIAVSRETEGLTDPNAVPGTLEYLAPEQLEGRKPDASSDLYALGVILYEMVTGELPYPRDSTREAAPRLWPAAPRNPADLNPDLPPALSRLILKCLARDPARRFRQAAEVCAELGRVESELPAPEPKTISKRLRKTIRSRPGLKWGLAAGLVVAFAATLWFAVRTSRGGEDARRGARFPPSAKARLVVLPFRSLDAGEEVVWPQALFHIIGSLEKSPGLEVVPYATALQYRNTPLSDAEIAKKHGASHVLRGAIALKDGRVVFDAELRRPQPDEILFSRSFPSRSETEYSSALNDIARLAAEKLGVKLVPARVKPAPADPQANRYYSYGLHFQDEYFNSERPADFDASLANFQKALEIEPAAAIIQWRLGLLYESKLVLENQDADEKLMAEHWGRAYELDPNLAEANLGMGWTFFNREEHDRALAYFKRALELDEASADVNFHVGAFLRSLGLYEQARAHYSRALVLEPMPAGFALWHQVLADCDSQMGEVAEAAGLLKTAMGVTTDFHITLDYSVCLIKMKGYDEAERQIAAAERQGADAARIARHRALLLAARGQTQAALELLKNETSSTNHLVTSVYAMAGRKAAALQGIRGTLGEKAFRKFRWYPYTYLVLKNNPFFDGLRDDPGFRALLAKEQASYGARLKKYGGL